MSLLERLLKVKDIESLRKDSSAENANALKRTLKLKDLVAFGIGAVIGSGVFVTSGLAAAGSRDYPAAGPAVMLSFIIVAIACMFCVLCYAEFASIIPSAGSAYTYTYATLGEFAAWILGWNLLLEYAVGNVAVAISWAGYFKAICAGFGLNIPDWMTISYFSAPPEVIASAPHILGIPLVCNIPAMAITMVLALLIMKGMRESATVNDILVVLKLLIIFGIIGIGAAYIKPENWVPFAPNGLAGIQAGAAIIFFAYIGFDSITTVAEETENPKRDMPLGMFITLAFSTVLYVATAAVITGMVSYTQLGTSEPMATAFNLVNLPWVAAIISIGAVISMTAVLFVFEVAQPRIFFVMARDGLVPKVFAKVHEKYRTPWLSTLGNAIIVALASGFMDLSIVIELCNIGTLFAFIMVCIGVLILRKTRPDIERPFRTPFCPWVPLLGIAFCLYLVAGMPSMTWVRFAVWVVVGAALYFCYGYTHSTVNHPELAADMADISLSGGTAADAELPAENAETVQTAEDK